MEDLNEFLEIQIKKLKEITNTYNLNQLLEDNGIERVE